MNWGAVLFCARLRRVCAGRRVKTGVFRSERPRFLAKAPNFSFVAPRFSCAAGECAVCSEERCAVSRPPREGGAEAACQSGRPARRSGGGVKNMPGGVVDRWWGSASERRQNDVFLGVRREKCRWAAKKTHGKLFRKGLHKHNI